jgi:hypothetical protein
VVVIEAQFEERVDLKYYEDFCRKFKQFRDLPEIAEANSSEDFFSDNLSSDYFQWAEIRESASKAIFFNRHPYL